ncbi:uncharacterized protein isoform X1 [Choristoneura fumiferana]|uniref:uncharacterized protein isoform X1 n=1 Tax=Choristoneura fumiferana TaxID=7141 RepID=UPI003D15AFD7
MKFMDKLPAVISCCFCCFLRAGTVMIALVSFVFGLLFAPNVIHTKGFWDMDTILSNYSATTESAVQLVLGAVSIFLCCISVMLLVGALFVSKNIPRFIEVYQWGALMYSGTVTFLCLILAAFCFFLHNDLLAGIALLCLIVCNMILTVYFVIVANSLRISLIFLSNADLML